MNTWYENFNKNTSNYITVKLTVEDDKKIRLLAEKMQEKKSYDLSIKLDGQNYATRWVIGLAGEFAVSKQLKEWGLIESVDDYDLNIGLSANFDTPDFIMYGLSLGCKTCAYGNCVKVKEFSQNSEIICVYKRELNEVVICGIATKEVLEQYGDLELITNSDILAKAGTVGGKVGFDRFEKLIPFTRENILAYKTDITLKRVSSVGSTHPFRANGNGSYILLDSANQKLIMRTVFNHTEVEVFDVDWPLNKEGMKVVRTFLEKGNIVFGYNSKFILETIQSKWCFGEIEVTYADIQEDLNYRYKALSQMGVALSDCGMKKLQTLIEMNKKVSDIEAVGNFVFVYDNFIGDLIHFYSYIDRFTSGMALIFKWYSV